MSILTSFLLKTDCLNGHPTVIRHLVKQASQGSTEQLDVVGTLFLTFEAFSTKSWESSSQRQKGTTKNVLVSAVNLYMQNVTKLRLS